MRKFVRRAWQAGTLALAGMCLAVLGQVALAQPPVGYYADVDTTSGATLRETIHDVIRNHQRIGYNNGQNWSVLEEADENPSNSADILDIYKNASVRKVGSGVSSYNREHLWPRSFGFPDETGIGRYPFSDLHALYLADAAYNTSRSNFPFRTLGTTPRTEYPTDFNAGQGGGSGVYPGNSNWRRFSGGQGYWEVWNGRKGDAARGVLYMDIRYEGGQHADGTPEPDLIAVNNVSLIQTTGGNASVAYMGILNDLAAWHRQDPPDDLERGRHEVIFDAQNNRNPFIDYPEWADCIYGQDCSGVAPMAPQGLIAFVEEDAVVLDWTPRPETNLTGYNVYRSSVPGGPYDLIGTTDPQTTTLTDFPAEEKDPLAFYYVVTAANIRGLESGNSQEVQALYNPDAQGSGLIISEYIEGSGLNKALEFYNASSGPVALDGIYELWIYFNGSDTAQTQINLTGTVAPGEVAILAHPSASSVILDLADMTDSRLLHNGDDAIELRRVDVDNPDGAVIDSIGEVGFQPPGGAWTANGVSTSGQTLVRKPGIVEGRTSSSEPFDPSGEWLPFPINTFDFLGFHDSEAEEPAVQGNGMVFF